MLVMRLLPFLQFGLCLSFYFQPSYESSSVLCCVAARYQEVTYQCTKTPKMTEHNNQITEEEKRTK